MKLGSINTDTRAHGRHHPGHLPATAGAIFTETRTQPSKAHRHHRGHSATALTMVPQIQIASKCQRCACKSQESVDA